MKNVPQSFLTSTWRKEILELKRDFCKLLHTEGMVDGGKRKESAKDAFLFCLCQDAITMYLMFWLQKPVVLIP